jgi:hypothetical protein
MPTRRLLLIAPVSLLAQSPGGIFGRLGLGKKGNTRMADGLKEALRIGAVNAVDLTGRLDGYFANTAIKLLLPPPILKIEKGLRVAGFGRKLDELVLGMNRAAEAAAPFAKDIFVDAIRQITISDAQKLLKGSDTAATDFFREKTTPQLIVLFKPPVTKVMSETGVSKQFTDFFAQVSKIPFLKMQKLDLESYVVDRALFGLFHVLGQEETKIRRDPAARVTAILIEVFGAR